MMEKSAYSLRNITTDCVTDYIEKHYIPLSDELFKLRRECENKYIPIIQRDVESLLVTQLYTLRPRSVLEIGTAVGYSAMVFAHILRELSDYYQIETIERNKDMLAMARRNIDELGYENINILEADALSMLKKIRADKKKFDFIFIDAGKSHYLDFWNEVSNMLSDKGVIICDNVFMRGMTVDSKFDLYDKHRTSIRGMRKFIEHIFSEKNTYTSLLSVGDGVTISYKK